MIQSRILIAVGSRAEGKELKGKLQQAGHFVLGEVYSVKDVLRVVFQVHPDVVILDADLPDPGGLDAVQVIDEQRASAVVFVASDVGDIVRQVRRGGVQSYLLRPYTDEEVYLAVEVSIANFQRLATLEQENRRLKSNLEARKLVDRAKGLLMTRKRMNEQEAYRYLRRLSMDRAESMVRIARRVIAELDKE